MEKAAMHIAIAFTAAGFFSQTGTPCAANTDSDELKCEVKLPRLRGELIDYMKMLFPSAQNNWNALR